MRKGETLLQRMLNISNFVSDFSRRTAGLEKIVREVYELPLSKDQRRVLSACLIKLRADSLKVIRSVDTIHEVEEKVVKAPRPRKVWSQVDDDLLARMCARGATDQEMAEELGRSESSVICRVRDRKLLRGSESVEIIK